MLTLISIIIYSNAYCSWIYDLFKYISPHKMSRDIKSRHTTFKFDKLRISSSLTFAR